MSGTETSDEEGRSKAKAEIQNATEDHGFLNKAAIEKPEFPSLYCTVKEVEDVKIVLRILPIFMSTFMLNCYLAQLSTFSVQQAATMNTKIGSLRIPPASLPVFPVLFVMVLALVSNQIIIPFARKITKSEMGITHLQRIGTGLVLSIVAMAIAALREQRWLRFEAIILHQFVELWKQLPQLGRVRVRRGLNRGGEAKRGANLGVVPFGTTPIYTTEDHKLPDWRLAFASPPRLRPTPDPDRGRAEKLLPKLYKCERMMAFKRSHRSLSDCGMHRVLAVPLELVLQRLSLPLLV
nr:protein NRT1/ PTR FAMILY 4.6-like [Ipomoea batatas]